MPLGLSSNAFVFTVTVICSLAFATFFFLQKRKKSKSSNDGDESQYVMDTESISGLLGIFEIVDDPGTLSKLLVDVATLAAFKGNQDIIRECGGLPIVMELVANSVEQVRIKAARALTNLAMNEENQKDIQACIPDVVVNLEPLDIGEEAAIAYLQLLINLAITATWHNEIVKATPRAVTLMQCESSSVKLQKEALKLLVNLSDNPRTFNDLIKANVPSAIQKFLKPDSQEDLTLRAVTCLSNMMKSKNMLQGSFGATNPITSTVNLQFPAATVDKLCTLMKALQSHPNQEIADQASNTMKLLLQ